MAAAPDSVSSPPIATRPSTPLPRSRPMTCSTPPFSLSGLVREVPRMVPPSGRVPPTEVGGRVSWAPARQDATAQGRCQPLAVPRAQDADPAVLDAADLKAQLEGTPGDSADSGVETGSVAAAGENADTHDA